MINSLINQKYFLSQKLQKEIFAILCTKKINTIKTTTINEFFILAV